MSKTDTMAKLPGLFQRDGVWTLRTVIPLDLVPAFLGRTRVSESLRTTDQSEGRLRGTKRRAEWLADFDQKRRELKPQRIETVTPALSQALAARVAASLLRQDDVVRSDPGKAALFLDVLAATKPASALRIGPAAPLPPPQSAAASTSVLDGLSDLQARKLAEVNANMEAQSALQMATQRIAVVLPLVKAEARSLGLEFDEKAPGALDALRESLKAYRKAMQDIASRDRGEVIETPHADTKAVPRPLKATKLRDVFPQWKASKARKPQTVQAAEKALALYEESTGNPSIGSLTRAQGVDMRAFLLAGGVSAKTARDRFDYIKGFLNFASRELELIPKSPWTGLSIEYGTTSPRRPWSAEQLKAYFSRPLHAAYVLPTVWDAGADAAYWVPLLGIFTGARISELCQLRAVDVETVDGVPMLRITDEGDAQAVKTQAGRRSVPVHPELIRLGFLEFAAAIRKSGAVQLFPALKLAKGKAGSYFSQWFSSSRNLSDGATLPDFHSMRHTVRSKLASAGVAEPVIDTLIGHEVKGSTGARVYTARTPEDLQRAMSLLNYSGLFLPRVYEAPERVIAAPKRGLRVKD